MRRRRGTRAANKRANETRALFARSAAGPVK
ncbi:hypothetical protein DM47_3593 [Burkholderia mallei]|nr:hypothetical protein DM50_4046 [Burkholderia mallei]KOT11588.1 hypothetical protein DM77_3581 [Burkholderia mallei]KOT21149.1 hypothetical protein DM47_3593 [Burkholderia mallei]KOT22808.1 hypothetical protein DM52_2746 [Burkholderia mallei]